MSTTPNANYVWFWITKLLKIIQEHYQILFKNMTWEISDSQTSKILEETRSNKFGNVEPEQMKL